ncbi:MAG TPA: tetratricopeptide repeat protein [Candidatus Eisenbacteria bacterium]|nr:tetratricopeptide repeat protein [Candidatus Eisenbacteria bacterium]
MTHRDPRNYVQAGKRPAPQHGVPWHFSTTTIVLFTFLAIMTLATPCSGQTPSGGKGTKQRVANPLNELLDEARRDMDAQKFEAAIAPLQKFIAEKDDFAYAHFQLGYVYTALGRGKEARPEYERALQLDPKMAEAAVNLGILLLREEPAAAVAPLQKAVELLPTQSRPRTLLGLAYEKSGDLKNAATAYEGVLVLDPKDSEASLYLAQLLFRQDRAPEAETRFRAVLLAEPESPAALLGLAQSLEAEKKPEAAEAYQNYLAVQPDDASARQRLVHLLIANQKFDNALAEMEKAQQGDAPSVESLKLQADILIGQKNWDKAIATLKQAAALAPQDAPLHGGLGRTYLQQRDFVNAEKELRAAIGLDGKNLAYWKDLTTTYYLAGNYSGTLPLLDEVAKRETPTPGELFIRALCYDKLQQTKAALEAYQNFLAADQDRNPDQVWQAQQRIIVLKKTLEKKR